MKFPRVSRLIRKLGAWADPRPWTLEEWVERHRSRVIEDVQRVLPFIPEDGLFVDVGANVGLFTECVLEHRPRARALLFEPVRRYYDACVDRLGDRENVRIEQLALSDSDEERPIFKAKHNYGANSVLPEIMFDRRENSEVREDTVVEEETIHCRVFSDYMREQGIREIDFIKTDTEGFDYAVLRGMLPWLREAPRLPVILSELLEEGYHPRWDEQRAVVDELFGLGYAHVDLSAMKKVDDILFVPESK
ncbi:MAG: FkbM family methyltransferase [bacterium]|nr:FkbM family methyltransferase [bacterium]